MTRAPWQIYGQVQQGKKSENRSTFIKVMNEYQVANFLWPTVHLCLYFISLTFSFFKGIEAIVESQGVVTKTCWVLRVTGTLLIARQ